MVQIQACDFRQGTEEDQSARLAVCENPILSLQHVGQRYSALAFDMDTMDLFTRPELMDIIIGPAFFYNLSNAPANGRSLITHKKVFTDRVATARLSRSLQRVNLDEATGDAEVSTGSDATSSTPKTISALRQRIA